MARFVPIEEVPHEGILPWQSSILSAMKQNVELLIGLRGEEDSISKSITKGQITIVPLANQELQQITAVGAGYTIPTGEDTSSVTVPSLSDYAKSLRDTQILANDLAYTRFALNTLIQQLKR